MELLSKSPGELQSAVPTGPGSVVGDSSAVQTLRNLMEEVCYLYEILYYDFDNNFMSLGRNN